MKGSFEMKIYELLRKIRQEKEMTQQQLADKVRVTVTRER